MASFRFHWHRIDGPFGLSSNRPNFSPDELAAIKFAFTNGSIISDSAFKDLECAANEFQKHFHELRNIIGDLELYVRALKVQAERISVHEKLVRMACSRVMRPFPPLPLDIAQAAVTIAAEEDDITAKNLTLVSRQVRQWADKELWRSVYINREDQFTRFTLLLQDPIFASTRARCIHRLQVERRVPSKNDLFTVLSSLPNLERFTHWDTDMTSVQDGTVGFLHCSSLRHISCDPRLFSVDFTRIDLDSAFFHYVTHLDVAVGDDIEYHMWSSWNWSTLKSLSHLTHLLVEMMFIGNNSQHLPCIQTDLIPVLPPSIQLVLLDIDSDAELLEDDLYNEIRRGELDRRILLCVYESWPLGEWVLEVGNMGDGRSFGCGPIWVNGGDDILWESGMDMLQRRNKVLDAQLASR
ncbi:hypothetical protein DL96DRAFT_1827432, partial [Flagelloscypha sp. PMI_526]